MVKFSIIISNINLKKDLVKTIEKIFYQTYTNFEILIPIIYQDFLNKKLKDIRIIFYEKDYFKNINGNYIIYIKNNTEINIETLKKITNKININPDLELIKFNSDITFQNEIGEIAFQKLNKEPFFNSKYLYVIKTKFYKKNNIKINYFIPYIILKANQITAISFNCYTDFINEESIFNEYDEIISIVENDKILSRQNKSDLLRYIIHKILNYSKCTNDENCLNEINKRKIYNMYPVENFKQQLVKLKLKYCFKKYKKKGKIK